MTQAKKPHIHAELIKAWADGATIQVYSGDDWTDLTYPSWDSGLKYRIKPEPMKTQRYRRFIWTKPSAFKGTPYEVRIINEGEYLASNLDSVQALRDFVRWIDEDWQEGVVVNDCHKTETRLESK